MTADDGHRALRQRWHVLCAQPGRDDLAAALAADLRCQLDGACAAALAATTDDARARAIGGVVRATLALQLARGRAPYRPGPYARELRERLGGALASADADAADDDDDEEGDEGGGPPPGDPADPFFAWHLGALARRATEPERGALVDAAIEAFGAIALAPIDPGNDLGPFTAIAALMNERQARRAASICEAMAAADWGLELSYARAYVYARLAALGAVDEAEALLPKIADPAARAYAEGRVLGHRVARGLPVAARAEFATADEVAQHHTGLVEALEGGDRPPPDALVWACVERARARPEGGARVGALLPLADAWCGLLPAETWLEAIEGCAGSAAGVSMLFELAARRGHEPSAGRLARVALERAAALPGASPTRWFDELFGLRAALPRADALAFFVDAMARGARAECTSLLQDLHFTYEFGGLLCWLGGDRAPAAVLLALDEVEALLA